uniref:AlNc14C209G8875 protein n=1 Tax=Albugo laibachii Nc14 TaxID=890382 RepID=F0WR67_9STRA|nr:AlNc14C209G8875 [Albugo laibachii Nc14]|eukprot:CCA23828.1 AlNc14C209G8875 [Albugo laibachii Nc14]
MKGSVPDGSRPSLQTREFHAALNASIEEKEIRQILQSNQESAIPPSRSIPHHETVPTNLPHSQSSCRICVGVLTYSRDIWLQRSPPICRGFSFPVAVTEPPENWDRALSAEKLFNMDEFMHEISRETHLGGTKPSPSEALSKASPLELQEEYDIIYLALGVSVYIDKWVPNGPFGRPIMGFAAHALDTNPNAARRKDLMAKKQGDVQRAREEKRRKQLGIQDVASSSDDTAALVEKDPLAGLKKPSFSTRFPPDMSFGKCVSPLFKHSLNEDADEFLEKAAKNSKEAMGSVYDFWSRSVEGMMENYVDTSRRILKQMPKVLVSFPHDASMTLQRMSTHFGNVYEDARREVREAWNEELQERKLQEERERNQVKQSDSKRKPPGKAE